MTGGRVLTLVLVSVAGLIIYNFLRGRAARSSNATLRDVFGVGAAQFAPRFDDADGGDGTVGTVSTGSGDPCCKSC